MSLRLRLWLLTAALLAAVAIASPAEAATVRIPFMGGAVAVRGVPAGWRVHVDSHALAPDVSPQPRDQQPARVTLRPRGSRSRFTLAVILDRRTGYLPAARAVASRQPGRLVRVRPGVFAARDGARSTAFLDADLAPITF